MLKINKIDPPTWVEAPGWSRAPQSAGSAWYATPAGNGTKHGRSKRWTTYPDGPDGSRGDLTIAPAHRVSGVTPILVMFPGEVNPFCLHSPFTGKPDGWTVVGDLDLLNALTVTPSILIKGGRWNKATNTVDMVERFHGHITNGEIV